MILLLRPRTRGPSRNNGLIGSAIGYLLGTSLYQIFILFPTDIVVRQKLSLGWGLVALTIGMVATTVGAAIPAIKASVLVRTVRLTSKGAGLEEEEQIRKIASLIRNFIFEWSHGEARGIA